MKRIGFQQEDRGMIPIDETIESVCVDVANGVNTFTAYLMSKEKDGYNNDEHVF